VAFAGSIQQANCSFSFHPQKAQFDGMVSAMAKRNHYNSSGLPWWLIGLVLLLMGFGGVYLLRGFGNFMADGGDITAPLQARDPIETATPSEEPNPANFVFATYTATPACQEFYVTVVRARVRECPGEECQTLDRPYEGNTICVWGISAKSTDWYQVNLDPKEPLPRIGYMHRSVIYPRNPTPLPTPTPRPSRTPRASLTPTMFPTVTPLPTQTFTPQN
jgi:hypothetical protein